MTEFWNPWHGCRRVSEGCAHCYVFALDRLRGVETAIHKNASGFSKPVARRRGGEFRYPSSTTFFTCFTSDFFLEDADEWRGDAFRIIRARPDCTFEIFTKRIDRARTLLPLDWGDGYPNVRLSVSAENQRCAETRISPSAKWMRVCAALFFSVDRGLRGGRRCGILTGRKRMEERRMIYASDYGFLPGADGMENARALQRAADMGGDISIDRAGVYDVSDTIVLKSGTRLVFCAGSEVRRHETPDGETAYLFINRGAYTREWDEQIEIRGLHLTTGGVCSDPAREGQKKVITGLSAQLAFSFIRDLVVEGYVVKDLPAESFGVQVCTFENARFENLWIEGRKDGVHLGRGRKFVIRHAVFRTFDDPIALNAHDYSTSNPQMGWIEDGVIEDCYDLDDEDTTGFFCRVLAGSWLPWREGMVVQRSDSVVYSGRVYRVVTPPDGRTFVSRTPPCHEEGLATYDGIQWCMAQADETLSCVPGYSSAEEAAGGVFTAL